MDHRSGRAHSEEHLRRHQGGGGEPVRAAPPARGTALPDPAHVAILPRTRRPPRDARGLRRRQRESQRVPLPPRRHRRHRRRPPVGPRAGGGDRLRPLHRQRHHAVHAGRPGRAADQRAGCRRPRRAGVRARVCGARLVDVLQHRPRLRQRAGAPRSGLAAGLRLRPHRAGPRGWRPGGQRLEPDDRLEGLPRRGLRRRAIPGGLKTALGSRLPASGLVSE